MRYPFDYFLQDGTVGFYSSAQIINIILNDRTGGKNAFHNIYTLVTLQEGPGSQLNKIKFGTKRPMQIDQQRSVMITFQDVEIDTVQRLYQSLHKNNLWHQPESDEPLILEGMTALSPVFVPLNPVPPIHSGLKNPFRYCQYLFEFYAEKKTVFNSITNQQQRKVSEWIINNIPIDLQRLTDRWGNIVFQLPVTLLRVQEGGSQSETQRNVQIAWHPKFGEDLPEVAVYTEASYDKTIHGYGESIGPESLHKMDMGSTEGLITTTIKRNCDNLILYKDAAPLMKKLTLQINASSQEKRKIQVPIKHKKKQYKDYDIELHHRESPTVIGSKFEWTERVAQRQHDESVKKLESDKSFVQYGSNGKNDREQALSDIRELIQTYGDNGVYLWDPFCDGDDILNTLFFCRSYGAPLKVITSFSTGRMKMLADEQGDYSRTFEERKQEIIEQLERKSNHVGIQLEVRCQYAMHGWKFHDRFLLFPGNPPAVWSLGTSINSIGSSHSILLKVEHAQPVINAFMDLWEELKEVVIWPQKQDI